MQDATVLDDEVTAEALISEDAVVMMDEDSAPDTDNPGTGGEQPKRERKTVRDDVPPPCPDVALATRIEVLLLSADRPMADGRIAELLVLDRKTAAKQIRLAVAELNNDYERTGRSFRVERLAGGYQMLTLPEFAPVLARLHSDRQQNRLSQPALETLAIIAYRQPILRADIEAIRGVACGEVLRSLMEKRLVKIVGRAEELGRPMLYGTTREFLKVFGLSGLDDLPQVQGLAAKPRTIAAADSTEALSSDAETQPDAADPDNKADERTQDN